jgi:hypothetical protein
VSASSDSRPDGRLRRAIRRFTLGSGPLKRRSDRLQMLARLVVVLAFVMAPPLAVLAATKTQAHLEALAATEAAERRHTTALTLEEAPTPNGGAVTDEASHIKVAVPAHWTTSSGADREGSVLVAPGAPAGTAVPIWIDQRGELSWAPINPRGIQGTATAMALLPLLGVPLAAWAAYAVFCAALDARRDRRWTEGWAAVEPRWNAQLP